MPAITGTSVLAADAAVLSASGVRGVSGTSVLLASVAVLVANGKRGVTAAPALAAGPATTVAPGSPGRTGTGTLVAASATLYARAYRNNFGDLIAGDASLSAVGTRQATIIANISAGPASLSAVGQIFVPDTGTLIAGGAALVATGKVGRSGAAVLIADDATLAAAGTQLTSITGSVDLTMVPVGSVGGAVAGYVPLTLAPTGYISNQEKITGSVDLTLLPVGSLTYQAGPASGLEGAYEATGKRTSVPTLVYVLEARVMAQIDGLDEVPADRGFLVASYFVAQVGDAFSEAGAGPDYIGTKKLTTLGVPYVLFRKPILDEVVWYVPDNMLFRYEYNRDTKTYGWKKYLSLPQRAIAGQYVFAMFDPEKVYDYYALIWGGFMWRWAYDTSIIAQQADPRKCSSFYLGALAAQWGYDLPADETLASRRSLTANAVPSFKFKGLIGAIRLRLQALGFRGYATEIWVNPENVNNPTYLPFAPLNPAGESSVSPFGAGLDYIVVPHGYDNTEPTVYFPSSRLALHVNEQDGAPIDFAADPVKTARIINALRRDVVPAHVDIRYLSTDHNVLGIDLAENLSVTDELDIFDVNELGSGVLAASPAGMFALGTVT